MRKLLSTLDYVTGAHTRRWRSPAFRGCGLVLLYHRIAPPGGRGDAPGYGVERGLPVDAFEAQMRFLLEHFRPARLRDLVPHAEPHEGVCFGVSFDDGYRDNLTLAAPVLERLGIPALIFLTTDFVGTQRLFWWERLGGLLRATRASRLELGAVAPELGARWALPREFGLDDERARGEAHRLISMALMRTPPSEIDGILARLASALGVRLRDEGREAPLLDWNDVRRWRAAGMDVGAHGASHANLGLVSDAEADREVRESLAAVARETDSPAEVFAYPYGGPEHRTAGALRAVEAHGCRAAFTTDLGVVGPQADRFALPRAGLSSASRLRNAYHVAQAFASPISREAAAAGPAR